jgi:bacterioferritin
MQTAARGNENGKLYDVGAVRREAQQSIEDGAVTKDYPLDLARTHALLNEALATEILCVLRYRHHEIVATGIDFPQVAAEFAEHAAAEQRHMMAIAERIDQLGGDPDFDPASVARRSTTEYGKASTLVDMIKEDLVAERVVIEIYRRLVGYFGNADPTTRRLVEQILADEEEHANDLASLLDRTAAHGHGSSEPTRAPLPTEPKTADQLDAHGSPANALSDEAPE